MWNLINMVFCQKNSLIKSIIFITAMLSPSASHSEKIEFEFAEGTLYLSFDGQQINRDSLYRYLIVHPVVYDFNYHIAPSLRLCIDGDSAYYECGSRDLSDPNFFRNAEVNIKKGERYIEELSSLTHFNELEELVLYFKSSLEFGVWKNERLLEYYKTWDTKYLSDDYKDLDIASKTAEIVKSLESTVAVEKKWKLSYFTWANAVNGVYREIEGEPPIECWNKFTAKYGITEKIVWHDFE